MSHNCLQPRSRVIGGQNVSKNPHFRLLAKVESRRSLSAWISQGSFAQGLHQEEFNTAVHNPDTVIGNCSTVVEKCVKCPNT